MKRNENGFTLIELLAVIVVLAIIMVIATMQINKTLLKSRTNAFIQSAEQVVKVAKNLQVSSELNTYNLRKAIDYSSSEYQIYVYEYNPAYECHAYKYNASAANKLEELNSNNLKSSYKEPKEFMQQFNYGTSDVYDKHMLKKAFNTTTHKYELDESEMVDGEMYYECIARYNYIASNNKDYTTTSAMIMIEANIKGKFNNVNFNIDGLNIKNNYNYDIFKNNNENKIRICAKLNGDGKVELADSSNGNINKNKATLCYSAYTDDNGEYTVIKP